MTIYEEAKKAQNQHELKNLYDNLQWKHINKFASKWNLATICIAIPEAVVAQLRVDFAATYPDKSFDVEWQKIVDGIEDDKSVWRPAGPPKTPELL